MGNNKQRAVRKSLYRTFDVPLPEQTSQSSHEEAWIDLPIRVEVKAGKQVALLWKSFILAEERGRRTSNYETMTIVAESTSLVIFRLSAFDAVLHDWPFVRTVQFGVARTDSVFARFFARTANQSEQHRLQNDLRQFAAVAMPLGTSDGLVLLQATTIQQLADTKRNQGDIKC